MNTDCIFCKIASKEIKAEILYESEELFVINDLNPQEQTHLLIVSKKHYKSILFLDNTPAELLETIKILARKIEIPEFRIQINTGASMGQTMYHLHIHFLSNSKLKSG